MRNDLRSLGSPRAVRPLAAGLRVCALVAALLGLWDSSAEGQAPKQRGPYSAGGEPFALVEYYNSENCLHCRKPTETVREIADRARDDKERIFVMTYHVDYLNIRDWDDIYESARFSERQRRYNQELRQRLVLPGQVIVNGKFPALAEHTDYVEQAVNRMLEIRAKGILKVSAGLTPDNRSITVDYTVDGLRSIRREYFYQQIAIVEDGIVRKIAKGPNAGHTFRHSNIVRAFETSRFGKEWKGSGEITLPENLRGERASLICFIEDPITLEVYAAERVPLSTLRRQVAKAKSR
jgi:hypothetical protein